MTSDIDTQTLHQLQLMVTKVQDNSAYMSWIISAYQKQEKLTPHKLIEVLHTTEETLAKLALCKCPDTKSKDFSKQVVQISEYTKIDSLLLLKMIRQVESVMALSNNTGVNPAMISSAAKFNFAAARDRDEENSTQENASHAEDEDDVADG
jgi:hypothetical protein